MYDAQRGTAGDVAAYQSRKFGIWDKLTVVSTVMGTVGLRSSDRSRHPPDRYFKSFCQPTQPIACANYGNHVQIIIKRLTVTNETIEKSAGRVGDDSLGTEQPHRNDVLRFGLQTLHPCAIVPVSTLFMR